MIIFNFSDSEKLAKTVAKKLNSQQSTINLKYFPDGESYLRLNENVRGKVFVFICNFFPNQNEKIINSILAAGAAKDSGAKETVLIATYLPYMRQDKQFNSGESISSRTILKTLSLQFDKIIAIDPHLHRTKTLSSISKNCKEITANSLIANYVDKNFSDEYHIIGPDSESFQWAEKISKKTNNLSEILRKTRFSSTHVEIEKKKLGKKIIIIDDMISTGHTILETIKIAKKQGAEEIHVITIHGLFLNNSDKKIKKYADLVCTNTIQNKYSKIDVSPIIIEELKKM